MGDKIQILICKVCDYYIGFEVKSVKQIIRLKKKPSKGKTVKFHKKRIPVVYLNTIFDCKVNANKFGIVMESGNRLFAATVSEVETITEVNDFEESDVSDILDKLTRRNYARTAVLFERLPVVVVDCEKLGKSVNKSTKIKT
jgi:chemotaxis signal transduction protein